MYVPQQIWFLFGPMVATVVVASTFRGLGILETVCTSLIVLSGVLLASRLRASRSRSDYRKSQQPDACSRDRYFN